MFTTLISLAISAASLGLVAAQYQDPNSQLVLDSPACAYYRCAITWKHGQTVDINWVNAPTGMVNLVLMTNNNTDVAYQIANVSSPSQPGYCDAGNGLGVVVPGKECGRFEFVVPSEWTTGRNYSVRAQLISDPNTESFTDVVQIQDAGGNPEPSVAFSAVPISGAPSSTADGNVPSSQTATVTAPVSPGASTPAGASTASSASGSGSSGSKASSGASGSSASSAPSSNTSGGGSSGAASGRDLSAAVPLFAGIGAVFAGVALL